MTILRYEVIVVTLLVAWAGVDSRGPASIYIAADSQISWAHNRSKYQFGRKLFPLNRFPDIIGYCGDILFPMMTISQVVEMADNGLLFDSGTRCKNRFEAIKEKIVQQLSRYPTDGSTMAGDSFSFVYLGRHLEGMEFFAHEMHWNRGSGWSGKECPLPGASAPLSVLGSGSPEFLKRFEAYEQGPTKQTSRAVFHCFCSTLASGEAPHSGGAPQLLGIYRKPLSNTVRYGIISDNRRFLFGAEVNAVPLYTGVEWRNELFERCDGATRRLLDGSRNRPDLTR